MHACMSKDFFFFVCEKLPYITMTHLCRFCSPEIIFAQKKKEKKRKQKENLKKQKSKSDFYHTMF